MGKLLIAVLVLVLGYFAFFKHAEPPKQVQTAEDQIEQIPKPHNPSVSSLSQSTVSAPISAAVALVATDSVVVGDEGSLSDEGGTGELAEEKDEPRENVDQTVIANEKRLAASTSSAEVFDLLQNLRIRMKKLSTISTVANTSNYAKFFGSYEGPVVNRKQESVYNLKLEIKQNPDPAMPTISGSFELDKGKDGKVKGDFNGDFGMQLVGRDGLVISNTLEMNNFQLYKLDNGMLAGNYYEKRRASYKAYKFILKRK